MQSASRVDVENLSADPSVMFICLGLGIDLSLPFFTFPLLASLSSEATVGRSDPKAALAMLSAFEFSSADFLSRENNDTGIIETQGKI
jgi:hypothetical protein